MMDLLDQHAGTVHPDHMVEIIIDNARRPNTFGLLMSLNMLIDVPGGFDCTGAQFDTWARTVGSARTETRRLFGPVVETQSNTSTP